MNHKYVSWTHAPDPNTESTIKYVEDKWGVKFPTDYRTIALHFNGCSPDPYVYDIGMRKGKVFQYIMSFNPKKPAKSRIVESYENVKDRLPPQVFPFADDPFGNKICFDYRNQTKKGPTIVYWSHEVGDPDEPETIEESITYICDTFTDLVNSLYDDEDES